MDILISLNIDQYDFLFELDIWKCDFSPVKEITGIEDLWKLDHEGLRVKDHGSGSRFCDHFLSRLF